MLDADTQNTINSTPPIATPSDTTPNDASVQTQATQDQQPTQMIQNPGTPSVQRTPALSAPSQPVMVSNPDHAKDPAVQRAGKLYSIAESLAGGPRMRTTIGPDGVPTTNPVPLSGRQIGLAIALEAISGGLAGLAAGRGHGAGAAGVAGLQQGMRIQQQRQAQDDRENEQAQTEFANRAKSLASKAAVAEVNSRTLLNTAEVEKYGFDAIQKAAEINRPAIDALDDSAIAGRQVTQEELLDGLQKGEYTATDHLGPIDGVRQVSNPDGTMRWEATHVVVHDPNAKITVTPEMYDRFAAARVPGFPATASERAKTFEAKFSTVQRANEFVAAHSLADTRLADVRDTLKGTPWADKVPSSVNFDTPGVITALGKFQRYVSHSASHGLDVYESLREMGQDKRDPKTGAMMPNPDAKYVDTVAQSFGGWPVLKAAHDKLQADSAATKVTAEAKARADVEVDKERKLIPVRAATAGAEAKARQKVADNADAYKTPDSLGFAPNVPGGQKEYNKRLGTFKKNADDLTKTEGTYQQFQSVLSDINAGKDMTGAQSVVGLFNAIGISATPMKGMGFRINNNIIEEHATARGWLGSLQQKFLKAKEGDVITPQQLKDYASIASQARTSQYVNLVNQVHNAGLNADFVLPTGNGQRIDADTAKIFFTLASGNAEKARAAAQRKGWSF